MPTRSRSNHRLHPLLVVVLTGYLGVVAARSAEPRSQFGGRGADMASQPLQLDSPDGHVRLAFRLGEGGRPGFEVTYRGRTVAAGRLGLEFAGSGPLGRGLKVVRTQQRKHDETYRIPVGKASRARDRHRELVVSLEEKAAPYRKLDVAFRAFNDGIAFRYRIPSQEPLARFVLTDEQTQLSFPGNPQARLLPLDSYTTPYEKYYETRPGSSSSGKPTSRFGPISDTGRVS